MGGGSKPKRRIVDYYMSIHYGVCHGPVDIVREVWIKDELAWSGSVTSPQTLEISEMELFGGDEKEGGVLGRAELLFGESTQVLSNNLARKLVPNARGNEVPGFRDMFSIFFHGTSETTTTDSSLNIAAIAAAISPFAAALYSVASSGGFSSKAGFLWSQNTPYIGGVHVAVTRIPVGLDAGLAHIQHGTDPWDANPAHMVYECYTNADWGLGWPTSLFNISAWNAAAQTLSDEKFGLSMMWAQQSEVEAFVAEILDHIQAVIFEDPATGLLEMKLIRGDYTANDLPVFGPENCQLQKPERRSLEDTTNEIVVTYTNRKTEEEATMSFQDLGNIASQGRVVSETRNYYGIRNRALATRVGARDLRASAYPSFTAEIIADRSAPTALPGSVVMLEWPELGIVQMPCRVMGQNTGKPGSGAIVLTVMEDIFGLSQAEYEEPSGTLWSLPEPVPSPFVFSQVFTLPAPALALGGLDPADPEVHVGYLAQQGDGDVYKFTVTGETINPDGSGGLVDYSNFLQTPVSNILAVMPQEASTVISQDNLGIWYGAVLLEPGAILMLGAGDDTETEIVMLVSKSGSNWTIARGMYDTTPKTWAIGTIIWNVIQNFGGTSPNTLTSDVEYSFWFRPRSIGGLLPLGSAPEVLYTPSVRPHAPFRPVNLRVQGTTGWGLYTFNTMPAQIDLSWANRNRNTEDSVAMLWTEASVPVEAGQTTTVRVTNPVDNSLIFEAPGLTGTTYSLQVADLAAYAATPIRVEAISVRDGIESIQNHARLVDLPYIGYGFHYGEDYGTGV